MNYSIEKSQVAYRMAAGEGLDGTDFASRVADLRVNPSERMMDEINRQTNNLTLMGQGSDFVKKLSQLTSTPILGVPIFKFVAPFVKIAGNVIDQSLIQRSALGLATPEVRADLMGRNGEAAQSQAIARQVAGLSLSIASGTLASMGLLTGSGPQGKDAQETRAMQAEWRRMGYQPYSLRIGNTWYGLNRLGALGMLVGTSASLYEVAHLAHEGEFLEAAADFHHAVVQNILDESFMKGVSDMVKAVEEPGTYGESYLRQLGASFVPFSVAQQQIGNAMDPYMRRANTMVDAMKMKIPIERQSLFVRRDRWGEPVPTSDAFGGKGVTAIYESTMKNDPVDRALYQLGIYPGPVDKTIRNVKLTDQEYDDFSRVAGRLAKQNLDKFVGSSQWAKLPQEGKIASVKAILSQTEEAARGYVMGRYPHIPKDAHDLKMQKIMGPQPR